MRTEVHYSGLVSLTKMHGAMKHLPAPVILSLFLILASCRKESPCVNCPPPDNGPDTTTHEFIWQETQLGDGSSNLFDVAIINDTLAYAVGEMYLKDSSGQFDPLPYNAAIWNGTEWSLKRIRTFLFTSYIVAPLEGIFAFSPTDIWCIGSFPIHGDGNNWTMYHLQSMGIDASVSKAWGVSSDDMYFVGRQGSIVRYSGGSWTKLNNVTSLPVQDIWGDKGEVLAVASDPWRGLERTILSITGTIATTVSDSGIKQPLDGIWFASGKKYMVVGGGFYLKSSFDAPAWSGSLGNTPFYSNAVRGTDTNNILVVGAFADILHYNGATWKQYPELRLADASLYGVAVTRSMVIAVGGVGQRALVIVGRKP
jgi:hypothetical protein